ncbi:MAG: hypothetical protein WBI09_04320 [Methanothrix sp.]|nr:hypothetical protein [Euryarchaeota archaeon]HRU76211.1 hypothetical protein [Methanothrix sp.]
MLAEDVRLRQAMLIYSRAVHGLGPDLPRGGMALSGPGGRAHRGRGRLCPAGPPGRGQR